MSPRHLRGSSSLIEGIIAEGKKEKIEPKDEAELIQTKKYLALQLKALVARDIWDMSQYFQVWNETNQDSSASRAAADYGEVTIEKTAVNC